MPAEVINQIVKVPVDVAVNLSDLPPVRQRTEERQGKKSLCGVFHFQVAMDRHGPPRNSATVARALRLCASPGPCLADPLCSIGTPLWGERCPATRAQQPMAAGVVAAAGGAGERLCWCEAAGLAFAVAALPFGVRGVRHGVVCGWMVPGWAPGGPWWGQT